MSELRILSEPGFSGFSDFQDCTVNIVVQGPYASPFLSESRIILKFQFQTGSIKRRIARGFLFSVITFQFQTGSIKN